MMALSHHNVSHGALDRVDDQGNDRAGLSVCTMHGCADTNFFHGICLAFCFQQDETHGLFIQG